MKKEMTEYLASPKNSLLREELTTTKLINDLQLAAFLSRRRLKIYKPTLDIEGCDIILEDDTDLARKFQLKTVIKGGKATAWNIHSRVLLPDLHRCTDYGIENVICPRTTGGVILQEVSIGDNIQVDVSYWYTDINVISFYAISDDRAYRQKKPTALKILSSLANKAQRINVSRAVFTPLKSPASILQIGGFHSQTQFDFDCNRLNQLHYGRGRTNNAPAEKAFFASRIKQQLQSF